MRAFSSRDLLTGEFWKESEANQFLHFNKGLFVGQFGTPNRNYDVLCGNAVPSQSLTEYGVPGKAGNSLSPTATEHDGILYAVHNNLQFLTASL
jgi:hypothetical protein